MADSRPTPVSFIRAVQLCLLLLFAPERFIAAEKKDIDARNNYNESHSRLAGAHVVRRAFRSSFLLIVLFGAVGLAAGKLMNALGRCATPATVMWLQIVGGCMLLWGTLFVRGWEIETFSGVVFTERVNQWLYRFLCCVGTSIAVYSVAFSSCTR